MGDNMSNASSIDSQTLLNTYEQAKQLNKTKEELYKKVDKNYQKVQKLYNLASNTYNLIQEKENFPEIANHAANNFKKDVSRSIKNHNTAYEVNSKPKQVMELIKRQKRTQSMTQREFQAIEPEKPKIIQNAESPTEKQVNIAFDELKKI